MSTNNENENQERPQALPLQIGMDSGEVEAVTQEISQSGVADNEADVERLGVPGPETGEDATGEKSPAFPVPIVTSD